ncbi:SDR family oxidoreductase [Zhongshania sp.]|jgi:NAD(P)-dependent dehydrogenase (short-subunit alcohol dehydrogenase family)|uniref:SDR family oxidoreductase n=1 Tax=Zhongshania sp. TaxID=1971902 RepID=UPI0039E4674D
MNGVSNLGINALFSLNGKVALITGGSRGIGRMMAQGLLQAGARVYISARNEQACRVAAEELSEFGECFAIPADIASAEGRGHLCRALQARESQLDILINNAGTAWGGDFETYPESAFEKLMNLNVTAVFALTRDLTPLLIAAASQADPARVINIGSIDGLHIPTVHRAGTYAYTASKAAVHHLTRHLAVELGPKFITVNAVAPGFFPSKMTDHVFGEFADDVAANSLLKRAGQAEEMAGIAIYLSSRAGAYTHGAVIPVDGGTSINSQHVISG